MNSIVSTAIVIAITSGIFAVLLTISNKYISNYGRVNITINDDTDISAKGSDTLLDALEVNAILIPALCGGKGTCGSCKVKVTEGSEELLPIEVLNLKEQDKKDGYRLACQYRVESDISIEVPEKLLTSKVYHCVVTQIQSVTKSIKMLELQLPSHSKLSINPSQYIKFFSPVYAENTVEVRKNYALSSYDPDTRHLTLFVKKVPNCICSTFIHHHLKLEDSVVIAGPFNHINYTPESSPLLMLCDDNGFGHVHAILNDLSSNQTPPLISVMHLSEAGDNTLINRLMSSFTTLNPSCNNVDINNVDEVLTTLDKLLEPTQHVYLFCGTVISKDIKKHLFLSGIPKEQLHFK